MITSAKRARGVQYSVSQLRRVCALAGSADLIDDAVIALSSGNVFEAIENHDNAALFDWLVGAISFQGIADSVAAGYMERHGTARFTSVAKGLRTKRLCPKLQSFWFFKECGYRKSAATCNQPSEFPRCPLPRHNLRNGHLNQAAYSLFLFMRDVADGDFIGWLDDRLSGADRPGPNRSKRLVNAVVEPMRGVYGVSDKVLNMTLSMLLLAGDPERERWCVAGAGMIAVDTLVHNWLHRTGILKRLGAAHAYGPRCYADHGCASIIRRASNRIGACKVNPKYPKTFPRFVQYAIWRYCSQSGLAECNGHRIDDRTRCDNKKCTLFDGCDRIALSPLAAPRV
jgi:hypothetical protein